jgi:AcrR family transcriptional regulator
VSINKKPDRRIQRTQELLGDALVSLAAEKGYDKVSIRDITERANVAYITFFRHYEDKNELLVQKVNEVVEELESMVHHEIDEESVSFHEAEGLYIFQHVQNHPEFYSLLTYGSARKQIQNALTKIIRKHLDKHTTTIPANLAAHHSTVSILGFIEWWLENNMPYPPEYMAQIYYQITVKPILMD